MKKIVEKMLAVALITNLSVLNSVAVGKGLVSLAVESLENQEISVKKTNIMFDAYLKNDNTAVHEMNVNIGEENKLYVAVSISGEGVLNGGKIKLADSNIKFDTNMEESLYVKSVSENEIELNQIRYGENVVLEIPVVFDVKDSVDISYMENSNTIVLEGMYKEDENEELVSSEILVKMNYTDAFEVDVVSSFEKNTALGNGKVLVEQVIESSIIDNKLPKESETVVVTVPSIGGTLAESVMVFVNDVKLDSDMYTHADGIVEFESDKEVSGNFDWTGKADVYKLVYVYSASVEERQLENTVSIATKALTVSDLVVSEVDELELVAVMGNIIDVEVEAEDIYKGYMYSGSEATEYVETIKVNVSSLDESEIEIEGLNTKLVLEDNGTVDISGKVGYKNVTVNKASLMELVGETGYLKVLDQSGVSIVEITKDSNVDSLGNVVVNIPNSVEDIKVVASKLVKEGTIELTVTRQIAADLGVDVSVLKQAVAIVEEKVVNQNKATLTVDLNETVTEVTVQMNNSVFTTAEENKDVQMVVNFNTSSNEYDLFKNPTIRIYTPDEIKLVTVNKAEIAYTDELEISKIYADGRDLVIELSGEQTTYTEETILGPALVLDLNVTLTENAAKQESQMKLEYTNENAVNYSEVSSEANFNIVTPKDLTLINRIKDLGINTIGLEGVEELKLEGEAGAITTTNEIEVVNNYEYDLEVAKVMGLLGNNSETNNLGIKILSEVNVSGVENSVVYYTANENATDSLENASNNWSTDIQGAIKYMVVTENFESASNMVISYDMEIPANLTDGLEAELGYEVIYGNEIVTNTMESTDIMLVTNEAAKISVELSGTVGNEEIGSTVKQNEVIKYTAVVKNEGNEDRTGILVTGIIPEGSQLIQFDYTWMEYNTTDDAELTETIDLAAGQEVVISYEVKVDSDLELNTELKNTFTTEVAGVTSESNEILVKVLQANLGVTIERRTNMNLLPETNNRCDYYVVLENTSTSVLKDIVIENPFGEIGEIMSLRIEEGGEFSEENGVVTVAQLEAGETIHVKYDIRFDFEETNNTKKTLVAKVSAAGETYTSNTWVENIVIYNATITANESGNKEVKSGDIINYEYVIKNENDNVFEKIVLKTKVSNELAVKAVYIDNEAVEFSDNSIEQYITLADEATVVVQAEVREGIDRTENIEISNVAELYYNYEKIATGETVTNTIVVETEDGLLQRNEAAEVVLTTTGESIVSKGDSIIYEYKVTNIGNVDILSASLKTEVPNELTIDRVSVNGYGYTVENNNMEAMFSLEEEATIKIETTVNSDTKVAKTFINEATVYMSETKLATSNQYIQTVINEQVDNDDETNSDSSTDSNGNNDNDSGSNGNNETTEVATNTISGIAWLDANEDGLKDSGETTLSGIKVKAVDVVTNKYATLNGTEVTAVTNASGNYSMTLPEGKYILVFEYDETNYKLSKYKIDNQKLDSDVFENEVNINGTVEVAPITDIITISGSNVSGVDIGLIENQIFDMKIDKYVSKIVLKDDNGTTTKEYDKQTLVKLEIDKNTIDSTEAIIEYEIVVSNVGEVSGYVKSIVDYLPSDLEFNSELNASWYKEGDNIYSNELYNQKINPGEEKTITLVVTKALNGSQGLTTNRAEIFQTENEQGIEDYNSTPGNNKDGENDLGIAEIIFTVGTGSTVTNTITILSVVAMSVVAVVVVKKKKDNK